MVNDEVSKVYESIPNKPGKYLTLTPAQGFEVGKRAAEHGVTATALASLAWPDPFAQGVID